MNYLQIINEKYGEIIKVINPLNQKQPLFDGILHFNGKYWEEVRPAIFEAYCIRMFERNNIFKENEQKRKIKQMLAGVTVEDTDISADYLFCIRDGVVDIRKIWELKTQNLKCDLENYKNEWLFPHDKFKQNYLTMYSDVEYIAGNKRDLRFFENLLRMDFLKEDEVLEWFFDYISGLLIYDNKCQQFLEFFGKKRTGKTTIVNFLIEIMGSYAGLLPEGILTDRQSDFSTALYQRQKKRLLCYSEPNNKLYCLC
jgi:phage/plasmid-associated DNA primase